MKTVIENKEFKVTFNGSSTWFVIDSTDTCVKYFSTEKKAINYFKKVSHEAGL